MLLLAILFSQVLLTSADTNTPFTRGSIHEAHIGLKQT